MRRFFTTLLLCYLFTLSLVHAESRIYIPHLKETFVLSKILQAFFNPLSVIDVKNKDDLIAPTTPRPTFKEGQVVSGGAAPVITDYYSGSNQYNYDGQCRVENIRVNPGDDLMGPKITGNLQYTQKFTYTPIDDTKCIREGNIRTGSKSCCGGEKERSDGKIECTRPANVKLDTKGRMIAGVNSPLLEELNKNLVVGDQSIFKRIYPQNMPAEIKEIPGSADYITSAGPAKLYFPHLGTIYDYFMKGIQKALRPLGGTIATTDECKPVMPALPASEYTCRSCANFKFPSEKLRQVFESAASYYKVPATVLTAIFYNEGGFNQYEWSDDLVVSSSGPNCKVPSCDSKNISSSGAAGPWQWISVYFDQYKGAAGEAGINDGRTPNRCNLVDATFAAAKKLAREKYGTNYPETQCTGVTLNRGQSSSGNSCEWNDSDVVTAARQYLGYCQGESTYENAVPCFGGSQNCYQTRVLRQSQCSWQ